MIASRDQRPAPIDHALDLHLQQRDVPQDVTDPTAPERFELVAPASAL